jgi:hypothetical protein
MKSLLHIWKPNNKEHNDAFREMLELWEDLGFAEFSYVSGDYCWANKECDFLLWDWPRIDDRPIPPFRVALFCNTVPNHPQIHPWTFFSRHPKKLHSRVLKGILSYEERTTESIFMGKIENHIQGSGRINQDWSVSVEEFSMPIRIGDGGLQSSYPYTQEEYQDKLASSKFGLLLPGYGPKCNRDIECMAHGTVPIVAPGCDVKNYHEPWIEGTHYISVNSPDEVKEKISKISKSEWEDMHNSCRNWYERNASPEGSCKLTKMLIEKYV